MNTVIGGRGSGKSSLIRFLRGVFPKKIQELTTSGLDSIEKDFSDFFSIYNKRNDKGVLSPGSVIELIFHRKGEQFKITLTQLAKKGQELEISRYSTLKNDYEKIDDEKYIDLFGLDIFSQKQIYDIGTKTNSLRGRIDDQVNEINDIKKEIDSKKRAYFQQSLAIRNIEKKLEGKGVLQTAISDIESRIETFNKSGVNDLIQSETQFSKDQSVITEFGKSLNAKEDDLSELITGITVDEIELGSFSEKHSVEIKKVADNAKGKLDKIKLRVSSILVDYLKVKEDYDKALGESTWEVKKKESHESFTAKKEELAEKGISDLKEIEREMKTLSKKKEELNALKKEEELLVKEHKNKISLKKEYITIRKSLWEARKTFLDEILKGRNVKAKISPFRDFDSFEKQLREYLSSETGYEDEVIELKDKWHSGKPEKNNERIFELFNEIRNDSYSGDLGKRFLSKVKTLNGEQMDEVDLLFPEDQIIIQYKTVKSSDYKSISNASPGQKTAAILTLLLSHGNDPLILDQPEDDLDNYLIYDLVVEQLRRSKEHRQIIVVTHNANIPVNGDSEHIIVMNSESKTIKTKETGTIENKVIKTEICNVMEGGTEAFEMRSKRYVGLN